MTSMNYLRQRILITNDDGIDATGLAVLKKIAAQLAPEVLVVAPDHERSGASQGISLHRTVRMDCRGEREYAVAGTPADCVAIACGHLMAGALPDLILSGINRGPNLGNETLFSGTVGAALTGRLFGIPAVALSLAHRDKRVQPHWETPERHAPDVLRALLSAGWPDEVCLNVNFPDTAPEKVKPFAVTRQGNGSLSGFSVSVVAEEGSVSQCEIELRHGDAEELSGTESGVVNHCGISVTPLHFNRTSEDARIFLTHRLS